MRKAIFATFTAGSIAVLSSMSAAAVDIDFFGQDRGPGESPPGLSSWANSSAAEASFLSYLVGVGTENFDSKTVGSGPGALSFPGAGTATMVGDAIVQAGHNGVGRYPISGANWVETSSSLRINFDQATAAFGFYGVDVGDFGGNLTLAFVDGTTRSFSLATAGMPGGSVLFFGYINDGTPFTSVTFGNTAPGVDYFAFDNMTIGSVEQVEPPNVPEAGATLGMLGFALVGLTVANRKLRKA